MGEFRKRIIGPLSIPVFAGIFIAAMVFSFSRILLAIPEKGSTTVALLMAAEILGVCAVLAAVTRLNGSQRAVLVAFGLALIGGGVGSAEIGVRTIEQLGNNVTLVAKNIRFDEAKIEAPADTEFSLVFSNNDSGVPHNVAITGDEAGTKRIFAGALVTGPITTTYKVPPLKDGTYFYHCDVHPTMKGVLTAGKGDGPVPIAAPPVTSPATKPSPAASEMMESPPAGGGAPTATDIIAKGFAFEQKMVELKAATMDTIHFSNQDNGVPHNVVITDKQSGGKTIYRGPVITGSEHKELTFTAPAAGKYFFHCEIHPSMTGTIDFK